jgi:UDPglucose 6-dehydrogenase
LNLIPAIKASNDRHKKWALERLREELGELRNKRISILGLTYKPGTSTLRRSAALELVRDLIQEKSKVTVHDPMIMKLPEEFDEVFIEESLDKALENTEAAVVSTEWPEFREADWSKIVSLMNNAFVVDANRFLDSVIKGIPNLKYASVGRTG